MDDNNQTPITIQAISAQVNIQGNSYTFDTKRLNYGQFCDMQAELKSGIVAKYHQSSGVSEMTYTKEFAEKENLVKTRLIKIMFALNVDPNTLDIDEVQPMLDILDQSGFMQRLSPKT